jgi:cytoskeletal protein CcmA (bactofilin family)
MREERGQIKGNITVFEPYTLWGTIGGDVRVIDGGKMWVRGAIYGNLKVEAGGRVHIYGNVSGSLTVHKDAKVIHSGMIMGNAVNRGGRLYIEATGVVGGKVKTKSGETKVEPKA